MICEPENVGLALVFAAEAEERRAEAELRALRDHLAPAAADDRAENRAGDLADLDISGALLACAVPCRRTTWLSSWAITPATSPSVCAASIMPRLTNIGPPGSANALISRTFTGSNV